MGENAGEWVEILTVAANLLIFPIFTCVWGLHGRISRIEGVIQANGGKK